MDFEIICHELGKDPLFKIWHASDQAMFIYMHSEGGSIVCSEKIYPIKKGVLCFVGKGKYHYTMPENTESYDRSKLFVSADIYNKTLEMLSENNFVHGSSPKSFIYAMIDESDRNKVEEIFNKMKEYEDDEVYGNWIMISCIIELLVYLNMYSRETIPATVGVMSKAIEYINENITRDISIDEICLQIHVSKYHFCRQFKKYVGMTVMKYILKTRLVMAENMLSDERLSITEVSNRCGFSSVSYFSRVFKEENGVTPLRFKKNFQLSSN